MHATITKVFTFEASHHLPNHDGKCRNPHGHSYKAEVVIHGNINTKKGDPKEGMVIDFADVKSVWKEYIEPSLDHQNLNDTLPVATTTAENIAAWICHKFRLHGITIKSVTVWETSTSSAEVHFSEVWVNGG